MTDELQGQLAQILSAMLAGAKRAGDFALEQLPEVAQQYVAYGRAWHTFMAIALVAVVCLAVWLARRSFRIAMEAEPYGGMEATHTSLCGLATLASLVAAGCSLYQVHQATLAWLAPKVWLLKEVAGLLK